ncbi:LytTR family transcriptional regulator DNA-binding domain-containing protein [Sphingobacterium siyangense]|uniref:LytTR family transcriptional regulator DNA-binding domain-containing protein n=1 Tax=Sphingobacterium siyangense TaxID=459529 RepID=UPI003017C616
MENLLDKVWFRLMLVLISSIYITEIGSMDSLATRLRTDEFYKEYVATVLISMVTVELIYFSHVRLERIAPWRPGHVLYRLLLQAIWGCFVPLVLVMAMATYYFYIYGIDIRRTDYFYFIAPLVLLLIILLNTIFIMVPVFIQYISHRHPVHPVVPQVDKKDEQPSIKVMEGNGIRLLSPGWVAASYIVEGKVVIKDREDKEYLADFTLDELERKYLPENDFFRVNRQLIVARPYFNGYTSLDYGKIEVHLSITVPVNTIISQLKSRNFKDWIETGIDR